MRIIILVLNLLISKNVQGSQDFFGPVQELKSRSKLSCCQGANILSCDQFTLDTSLLGNSKLYLSPLNVTLDFLGMVGESDHAYHYGSSSGVDFIVTHHVEYNSVYGHASITGNQSDRSFVIEFCGDKLHVLKELDIQNLGEIQGEDLIEEQNSDSRSKINTIKGSADTRTIVTYTVKVYYTPQFAATTADIDGFIDQVIQETNQGYINSQVPLRVRALCSEQATVNDISNGNQMLSTFRSMKGTTAALRDSADMAALLVNSFSLCGIGYLNTIGSGLTVSVTAKNCALGLYVFGHELGHNIGLHHNTQVATNNIYPDGHGHLIAQGSASTGYRTIMAYSAPNHRRVVNYYSNPNVQLPITGTPTGIAGISNNARILTANRFALANVGDESSSCSTTRPTTTATTTTTFSPVTDCAVTNMYQFFRHQYIGRQSISFCRLRCNLDVRCIGWTQRSGYNWCYLLRSFERQSSMYNYGPDLGKSGCTLDQSRACTSQNTVAYLRYVGRMTSNSADACHTACRNNSLCTHWVWSRSLRCSMYQAYDRRATGWTSGPKTC